MKAGANLTELVQDLNKDLGNPNFPNAKHAFFKTNDNGSETLIVKPAPFGGVQFHVNGNSVDTPQTLR